MSVKLTYFGHFALGLDIDGTIVLIDPFFTGNPSASAEAASFSKVDYILVTHGHADHVGDTVALAKRTGARVVSNFEIIGWLQKQGLENVHPQHIGGAFDHGFGTVKLTIAQHGSALPDGSYGGLAAGLLIKTQGKNIYVSGDTGLFYDMKLIGEEGLDLAVIPIGDNFTMGPTDALRAVKLLQPRAVVPAHYNTWDVIAQDGGAWAARTREETGAAVHLLAPGDSVVV